MSLGYEDRRSLDNGSEKLDVVLTKRKIYYSRDFLLSLSNLDICKKLPSGFDESLISEFEDALLRLPDRPRIPGSLPVHGFRRIEYGSSPPTRGGSGSYPRGTSGKWGSRSSGRSDRDSDSQSDRESGCVQLSSVGLRDIYIQFSGCFSFLLHYQIWLSNEACLRALVEGECGKAIILTPEHDGLLGSGSFPRPSGYAAGISAAKVQANEHHQLGRSSEPYHPPRPYKVQKPVKGKRLVDAGQNLDQNTNNGAERQLSQEISVVDSQPPEKAQHGLFLSKGGNVGLDVSLDVPIKKKPGMEDQLLRLSGHLDSHGTLDDPEIAELNATRVFNDKSVRDSDRSHSTSVLEKILGSTLSVNDGHASSAEHHDSKPDGTWSPNSVQSSKFAQWFFEEEAKVPGVVSSTSPNGLLSLIVSADGVSDQACINNKEEGIPTVLTCEDLEQSILSEYHAKTTNVQPCLRNWGTTSTNTNQPSTRADDHASLQLLSMLQKSTDQNTTTVSSDVDINLADKQPSSQENDLPAVANKAQGEENNKVIPNLGKTLTLETLFGTAFMKELQSVEAPVSVQKGSIGTAEVDAPDPHGLPLPITNNDIASSTPDETGFQRPGHDFSAPSNHRQRTKLGKAESWHGSEDSTIGITTSKLHTEAVPKHCGLERVVEFQLPEEENLMSAGGTQDKRMLAFMPTGNSITNINLSSDIPINLSDKLAALGAFVKDKRRIEGLETLPFARNSYEQMEPEIAYGNVQVQHSSPLFQPQMTKVRQPPYPHLEPHHAHMNSRMKFLGPEPINNHDSPANHQFSSSMIRPPFHHPNVRIAGFDVPSQQSMLHQMQISGNNPPHMLPDFPRGGPVSQHSNQATGFIQEMNQMQGFPFGPRQPTMGSRGAPIPANPPEALQRFIEVELRANSRQIHPFAPGHSQGMYGHEVDMGLRYR
ncbi:UNVERIFIED_CONTAM: hypothetical protein Sindi_1117600 [Sesamum indicum]